MTKHSYLKQLSFLLKFSLPQQEAQDIIQDYQEILSHTDNIKSFGTPYQAIKPLLPPIHKNRWFMMFLGCMFYFLFALGGVFFPHTFPFWIQLVCYILFAVFLHIVFGKTHAKPPKAIIWAFAIVTICNGICFFLGYQIWLHMPVSMIGIPIHHFLLFYSVCCAMLATATLILCKISHKQWHSITILAIGMVLSCGVFISYITQQNIITTTFATMLQHTGIMLGGAYLMAVIGLC